MFLINYGKYGVFLKIEKNLKDFFAQNCSFKVSVNVWKSKHYLLLLRRNVSNRETNTFCENIYKGIFIRVKPRHMFKSEKCLTVCLIRLAEHIVFKLSSTISSFYH